MKRPSPIDRGLLGPLALVPALALSAAAQVAPAPRGATAAEPPTAPPAEPVPGERLDPSAIGPTWIETMAEVERREAERTEPYPENPKARNGAQGTWTVPSLRWTKFPHSGEHYAAAKWGDTSMGIGFGEEVDLVGVWVAGHMDIRSWTPAVRALGYRGGKLVATSAWFEDVDDTPSWFAISFEDVDRVVFEARPVFEGAGFYGIDDLTFVQGEATRVVDFEEPGYRATLTGSDYAGLSWETGTGDFSREGVREMPAPETLGGAKSAEPRAPGETVLGGGTLNAVVATAPTFVRRFAGPKQSDPGGGWVPPDTCGAIGTTQFVASVNQHLSVYDRATENRLTSVSLQSFFNTGGNAGDPRVAFDHHHDRWIVIATDFSTKVRFAYSLTEDATGPWLKTNIILSQGSNSGDWPDYPTLGVDANGVYMAAFMVGSVGMSIFAVDKAPLLAGTPSVGTVSAWRQLPWEGAVQPCVTYGNPGSQYLISRRDFDTQRIRRIDGPLTSPTLVEVGFVDTKNGNSPPSAPALGSTFNLDALDGRPMNAVFRNGAIWMTHCVGKDGRAAINWYKIGANATLLDEGTIKDPVMSFIAPSISVNANDDVLIGFTASSPSMYASCWYTGRAGTDPAGEMAPAAAYKDGNGAYNQSSSGTNRWGDYSVTSTDPLDDLGLWTIQEFTNQNGQWATNIGEFSFDPPPSCGLAVNYCTAGNSASGCQALISTSGTPSATAAAGFSLVATGVEGAKDGLFFYGANGRQANPWGNGTSFQCVVPPVFRAGLLPSTGTNGLCDGSFSQDLHALWSSNPAKNPGAGAVVQAQLWYRDPLSPSNQTTSLSDAVEFTVCP